MNRELPCFGLTAFLKGSSEFCLRFFRN